MHGYAAGKFNPFQLTAFLGLVPLLLFNYVGFELQNGAAEEMVNPQKDVPTTVIQGGAISTLAYCIPVFGILAVLPASKITGIGGFLDAVKTTFSVYGGAAHFMTEIAALGFIFALVTSGSVWMMGSDRIQAVAAYDGAFFPWFGKFNAKLGTPVRVNVLSGVASTIFMVAAVRLQHGLEREHVHGRALPGDVDDAALVPADLPGRAQAPLQPPAHRAALPRAGRHGRHVGDGRASRPAGWCSARGSRSSRARSTSSSATATACTRPTASRVLRFEVFTLGTLGVIILIAIIGYIGGASARASTIELGADVSHESMATATVAARVRRGV